MEPLLDLDDPDMTTILQCGYFEDVVEHFKMGPSDPHIRPWIEGNQRNRKCVLLEIAKWLRLDEQFLFDIVSVLAADSDECVASCARRLLDWKTSQDT